MDTFVNQLKGLEIDKPPVVADSLFKRHSSHLFFFRDFLCFFSLSIRLLLITCFPHLTERISANIAHRFTIF